MYPNVVNAPTRLQKRKRMKMFAQKHVFFDVIWLQNDCVRFELLETQKKLKNGLEKRGRLSRSEVYGFELRSADHFVHF